jgi:methionine synthase II (cobalamin-independent)
LACDKCPREIGGVEHRKVHAGTQRRHDMSRVADERLPGFLFPAKPGRQCYDRADGRDPVRIGYQRQERMRPALEAGEQLRSRYAASALSGRSVSSGRVRNAA